MPPQSGETTLSTVFADLHYVFSSPGQRPAHDRFEKGSYVYVHHNASSGTGRIEVANNAGTPNQDAFDGSLESARISFSHKRPSQLSIAVVPNAPGAQWQLPDFAPGQDKKYMYPIQELDIYFWTAQDAQECLDAVRKIRAVSALNVQDAPPQQQGGQPDTMSPVVQKLEQAAISTPYQQHQRDSGSINGSTGHPQSFPPPPPVASRTEQQNEAYKPVAAYNPAAPPPPEPIAHREKTPPPMDANDGTGLAAANKHDHVAPPPGPMHYQTQQPVHQQPYVQQPPGHHPYSTQPQSPFAQSFSPSPSGPTSFGASTQSHHSLHSATPPQRATSTGSFPPPPPTQAPSGGPQSPYAASFSPPPHPPQSPYGASFAPPPTAAQQAQHRLSQKPTAAGYSTYHQGPTSPGFPPPPPQSPGFAPPPAQQQQQQQQQQQPHQQHHYSQYSYGQPSGSGHVDPQSIHNQVYRPTEAEAAHAHGGSAQPQGSQNPGGLSARTDRLEKGISGFLKKMDKKFG